jgi:hypothetical protein
MKNSVQKLKASALGNANQIKRLKGADHLVCVNQIHGSIATQ